MQRDAPAALDRTIAQCLAKEPTAPPLPRGIVVGDRLGRVHFLSLEL
jgi:hypothetical protein